MFSFIQSKKNMSGALRLDQLAYVMAQLVNPYMFIPSDIDPTVVTSHPELHAVSMKDLLSLWHHQMCPRLPATDTEDYQTSKEQPMDIMFVGWAGLPTLQQYIDKSNRLPNPKPTVFIVDHPNVMVMNGDAFHSQQLDNMTIFSKMCSVSGYMDPVTREMTLELRPPALEKDRSGNDQWKAKTRTSYRNTVGGRTIIINKYKGSEQVMYHETYIHSRLPPNIPFNKNGLAASSKFIVMTWNIMMWSDKVDFVQPDASIAAEWNEHPEHRFREVVIVLEATLRLFESNMMDDYNMVIGFQEVPYHIHAWIANKLVLLFDKYHVPCAWYYKAHPHTLLLPEARQHGILVFVVAPNVRFGHKTIMHSTSSGQSKHRFAVTCHINVRTENGEREASMVICHVDGQGEGSIDKKTKVFNSNDTNQTKTFQDLSQYDVVMGDMNTSIPEQMSVNKQLLSNMMDTRSGTHIELDPHVFTFDEKEQLVFVDQNTNVITQSVKDQMIKKRDDHILFKRSLAPKENGFLIGTRVSDHALYCQVNDLKNLMYKPPSTNVEQQIASNDPWDFF